MNVRDLLRLSSVPRLGPLKIRALVTHFGDPEAVLRAEPRDLIRVPGIDRKLASAIVRHDGENFADEQLRAVNRIGGCILPYWDNSYPSLLKKIYDPPPLLYVLGGFTEIDRHAMGIVGTRKPSSYGQRVTENLTRELMEAGITVVSGLARGIDTIAHETALKAGGRTIAVIGSGLDVPYPPENRRLLQRIARQGVVMSEFPLGTQPEAPNFPRRNRLISGISLGVIVVESDEDGGAMITASTALDQNREVFAVPGMITERRSIGPHLLIQQGRAKLVHTVNDVLVEFPALAGSSRSQERQAMPLPELTLFENTVLESLSNEPVHIDVLSERASLSTSDCLVTLLSLEFKGLVRQLPGKFFVKAEGF